MYRWIQNSIVSLGVVTAITGCKFELDSGKINDTIKINNPSLLRCSANLPNNLNGIVESGVSFPVKVTASGGSGQYSIKVSGENFATEINLVKSFTNSGANNETRTDTIQIQDGSGIIAECSYQVTVRPTTSPSDLACSISSGIDSPHVNQYVPFVVSATGGASSYSFSQMQLGTDGSLHGTPIANGANYYATGRYSSDGVKTISATVSDGDESVTCTRALTVRPALAISVASTPSASVRANSVITLTASSQGFAGTPTFSFTSTDSGAVISSNGNVAMITSQNETPRSFSVTVTATQGSETVSTQVPLNFTTLPALTCSLSHPSGVYRVNEPVLFSVTADTGEAVEIVSFYGGANGAVENTSNNSRRVTFSSAGYKAPWAIAKVRRGNSEAYCNYGNYLYDTITIEQSSPRLACNAFTNPNASFLYETVYIDYQVTQSGYGGVELAGIKISGQPFYSRWVYFYQPGVYPIEVTIRDIYGYESTCHTQHLVY